MSAVIEMGFSAPSEIQSRAIPAVMRGESVVLAAGTGTGKTLAYLLPVVHKLKEEEQLSQITARDGRPRAIVLAPTRELALQVLGVCKRLCHTAKFRAVGVVGGTKQSLQRETVDTEVDVLVATPGRLALLLEQNRVSFADVRYLVIDECDTMVSDRDFGREVEEVLTPLKRVIAKRSGKTTSGEDDGGRRLQVVLVGATIPGAARHKIGSMFPGVSFVATPSVHKPPGRLHHRFIRIGGEPTAKHDALMRLMSVLLPEEAEAALAGRPAEEPAVGGDAAEGADGDGGEEVASVRVSRNPRANGEVTDKGRRVIVFCNSIPSARSTAHFLSESGLNVASLHGGIPPTLRKLEYDAFLTGQAHILVATDAAARGLDIVGLDSVVMFDFPLKPVDYLHRAGRAGRAGQSGTVASLIGKGDVVLASKIQRAIDEDQPLDKLTGRKDDVEQGGKAAADSDRRRRGRFTSERKVSPERRSDDRRPLRRGASSSGRNVRGSSGRGMAPPRFLRTKANNASDPSDRAQRGASTYGSGGSRSSSRPAETASASSGIGTGSSNGRSSRSHGRVNSQNRRLDDVKGMKRKRVRKAMSAQGGGGDGEGARSAARATSGPTYRTRARPATASSMRSGGRGGRGPRRPRAMKARSG